MMLFSFRFRGHENITATHRTTFAFTSDGEITPSGDCFIGVCLETSPNKFPEKLRSRLCRKSIYRLIILCEDKKDIINISSSEKFSLTHRSEVVFRKSSYICDKTAGIGADKSAIDIDRDLIELLRNGKNGLLIFEV